MQYGGERKVTMININCIEFALSLPRLFKRLIVLSLDLLLCIISIWLAYYLRLGYIIKIPNELTAPIILSVAISVIFVIPIFLFFGLYHIIFRYSGVAVVLAITRSVLLYGILYSAVFTIYGVQGVPRTIGIIQPLILFILVVASRTFAKIWLGNLYNFKVNKSFLPQVLIYGAGNSGSQLASALANNKSMNVVGFLDDNPRLHGIKLNGLEIYNPKNIIEIIKKKNITDVLLALPSASRIRRKNIIIKLSKLRLSVRTLPDLNDLASGKISISDVRELDIDDLLGRESVKQNEFLIAANIKNKTVLVTGAGGSIGSELCRQIIKFNPKKILLFEISEFALYKIHQEILKIIDVNKSISSSGNSAIEILPLLGSVCDQVRMNDIVEKWLPDTIYHAAAYKHVPLVEHNIAEGVRNNVMGTLVCAQAAVRYEVSNFVLISTDKAVRPTNIMGASKRLSEMMLQALSKELDVLSSKNDSLELSSKKKRTCFSMVRFGNVLDSSGSVVPLFREQVKNGGPITLTHPDITRYFMTIPEAAQLVIQAGAMGEGGDVFVLDMGQPVKIHDLARRIVKLSGLTIKDENNPNGDIEIRVTGLRPGEKLFEELLIGENPEKTIHPLITKAHENFINWDQLKKEIDILNMALNTNDVAMIRSILQKIVDGFLPSGQIVDWVYLEANK